MIAIPYMVITPILAGILMNLLSSDPRVLDTLLLEVLSGKPTLWDTITAHYIPVTLFILFPISLILNVVWALFLRWDTAELARWNLRIKLWLIPFYLFIFIFAIGVPLAVPLLFLFDGLLMIVSSCYGFRTAVRSRKEGRFGDGLFLILFLGHFFFVADVIAAFVLKRKIT